MCQNVSSQPLTIYGIVGWLPAPPVKTQTKHTTTCRRPRCCLGVLVLCVSVSVCDNFLELRVFKTETANLRISPVPKVDGDLAFRVYCARVCVLNSRFPKNMGLKHNRLSRGNLGPFLRVVVDWKFPLIEFAVFGKQHSRRPSLFTKPEPDERSTVEREGNNQFCGSRKICSVLFMEPWAKVELQVSNNAAEAMCLTFISPISWVGGVLSFSRGVPLYFTIRKE